MEERGGRHSRGHPRAVSGRPSGASGGVLGPPGGSASLLGKLGAMSIFELFGSSRGLSGQPGDALGRPRRREAPLDLHWVPLMCCGPAALGAGFPVYERFHLAQLHTMLFHTVHTV